MSHITLADLNACSREDFVARLGNIFEYSPWIAEQAAAARPFVRILSIGSSVGPLAIRHNESGLRTLACR